MMTGKIADDLLGTTQNSFFLFRFNLTRKNKYANHYGDISLGR